MSDDLPSESGLHKYDGEYHFGVHRIGGTVSIAPGLDLILVSEDNSLCPSRYNSTIMCFWEGSLSVTFRVPGKEFPIIVSDHDLKPNAITHGEGVTGPQWTTFSVGDDTYRIIGTASRVEEKMKDMTFLQYRVTRA